MGNRAAIHLECTENGAATAKTTPAPNPKFKVSSIMEEALWQVWRWDSLAEVRVQEGEPLENALRRFKRKVQQEDIIKEVKRHSYYLKPVKRNASRQLWRASGIARRLAKSRTNFSNSSGKRRPEDLRFE